MIVGKLLGFPFIKFIIHYDRPRITHIETVQSGLVDQDGHNGGSTQLSVYLGI